MPGFGADGELLEINRICNFLDSEAISLANRSQYENKYSKILGLNYSHSSALAPINLIKNSLLLSDDAESNKSVLLMVPIKGKDAWFLYEEVWFGSAKFATFFELFKFITEQNLRVLKSQLI